jgi:hypothetical protein
MGLRCKVYDVYDDDKRDEMIMDIHESGDSIVSVTPFLVRNEITLQVMVILETDQ